MTYEKRRKILGLIISAMIIVGACNPQAISFFSIPTQQRVVVGDQLKFDIKFPERLLKQFSVYVDSKSQNVLNLNGLDMSGKLYNYYDGMPLATSPGTANVQLRLFGILPVKNVQVQVLPQTKLVPGGHSVGVLLHSEGVIVVGQSIVQDKQGHRHNPAAEAGLKVGDVILKINGKTVTSDTQVASIIDQAGKTNKKIIIKYKRDNEINETEIKPILCGETGRYRIGLYIRDSAAGVGTLSFYNPATGRYGALGHVISDADTNKPIEIGDGKIVRASIQGIQAGLKGRPGEKIGMFINDKQFAGSIDKNTKFGIYGTMNENLTNPFYNSPIPIALADQIKEGPAEMLTVLDGEKIEKFQVRIKKIIHQQTPDSKGLIIEVTDSRLLKRTGGIIQGMSGSPLIQDGKLIGAVTHVFINDPTKGYGCFIEWMLMESNGSKAEQRKAS